jgi:hypothetical protein
MRPESEFVGGSMTGEDCRLIPAAREAEGGGVFAGEDF